MLQLQTSKERTSGITFSSGTDEELTIAKCEEAIRKESAWTWRLTLDTDNILDYIYIESI
jgi:hypothetical protein